MITLPLAKNLLGVSKLTAIKAHDALQQADILHETMGNRRDCVHAYHDYLQVLYQDTE